jgi:yeast amino acid transporter
VPAEISAAAVLVQYWNQSIDPAVWITIFMVFIVILNFCGVRLYGEVLAINLAASDDD